MFDWESALPHLDVNKKVSVFNNAITDIISNFVTNEINICDDQYPPWMKHHIKNCIFYRANFYKTFVQASIFHLLNFNNLSKLFKSVCSEC